jgi:hypothetical protein
LDVRHSELRIATGVIAVMVRADDVLHRLRRYRFYQSVDLSVVGREHVIDQNDAFVRYPYRDRIPARSQYCVEARFHHLDCQWRLRRLRRLTLCTASLPLRGLLSLNDGDSDSRERRQRHNHQFSNPHTLSCQP